MDCFAPSSSLPFLLSILRFSLMADFQLLVMMKMMNFQRIPFSRTFVCNLISRRREPVCFLIFAPVAVSRLPWDDTQVLLFLIYPIDHSRLLATKFNGNSYATRAMPQVVTFNN